MLAVAFVLEAFWRPLGDKGLLLVAIGTVLAGIGAFGFKDPREGLLAWVATVFGAVYVGLSRSSSTSPATRPRSRPAPRSSGSARSAAGCCS